MSLILPPSFRERRTEQLVLWLLSGALTPSTFTLLPQYNVSPRPNTWVIDPAPPTPFFYTGIDAIGGHGNGDLSSSDDVVHWAVRRWVAETSGLVTISGNIADLDIGAGGMGSSAAFIMEAVRSTTRQSAKGNLSWRQLLVYLFDRAGTPIDFVIDPNGNNDLYDSSRFTALITLDATSVPEPTGLLLTPLERS